MSWEKNRTSQLHQRVHATEREKNRTSQLHQHVHGTETASVRMCKGRAYCLAFCVLNCLYKVITTVVVFFLWCLRMGLNIYFCTACQALFSCQRLAPDKLHLIVVIMIVTCTGAKLCQDLQCSTPPFYQHAGHYKSYVDSNVHQHPTI